MSKLCNALAIPNNLSRFGNGLFTKKIFSQEMLQSIMSESCDDYNKASKLVQVLYRQLKAHKNSQQYLNEICDVLLQQPDEELKEIGGRLHI